jgi:hypothetical protein
LAAVVVGSAATDASTGTRANITASSTTASIGDGDAADAGCYRAGSQGTALGSVRY